MAEAATPRTATTSGAGVSGWTKQVTCRYFMHGVCKEGDTCHYSYDLSDSPYVYKPLKQEEATATEQTTKSSLVASSSPSSIVGPLVEMNTGKAESRNSNFATIGAGTEDGVNATEFVPGQPYCGYTAPSCTEAPLHKKEQTDKEESEKEQTDMETKKSLCPYAAVGECRYGDNCVYLRRDSGGVLHPTDAAQRSQHIKLCIEAQEKDMELLFAVPHSKDMVCGICMEVVYEKTNPSELCFRILSNCNHAYCFKCIHKRRSAKQFESKIKVLSRMPDHI
uniref:RING-type E3 ubiquitin transferase n=1 Tax=Cebus imitator TaxID=2715852 RepID=A0A2K5PLX2_CEBIM